MCGKVRRCQLTQPHCHEAAPVMGTTRGAKAACPAARRQSRAESTNIRKCSEPLSGAFQETVSVCFNCRYTSGNDLIGSEVKNVDPFRVPTGHHPRAGACMTCGLCDFEVPVRVCMHTSVRWLCLSKCPSVCLCVRVYPYPRPPCVTFSNDIVCLCQCVLVGVCTSSGCVCVRVSLSQAGP